MNLNEAAKKVMEGVRWAPQLSMAEKHLNKALIASKLAMEATKGTGSSDMARVIKVNLVDGLEKMLKNIKNMK